MNLFNKYILITGASSGIGKATAIECAKAGAKLVITARNSNRLQETLSIINDISGNSDNIMICADLTTDDGISNLVNTVPQLDGAFFCAGVSDTTPLKFISRDAINRVLDINLVAPMLLTQSLLLKKKIKKGGALVYMSSMGAEDVTPGLGIYAASKNGLNAFVRTVATEQANRKVRANAIMASMVKTELINTLNQLSAEDIAKDEAKYPLGYGETIDIANAAIYLLSDSSKWMTGSFLKLDGGSTLSL